MEVTRELVARLPIMTDPNLLVGAGTLDDAGVYKLTDQLALVMTLDLFPPVVDDPLHYGRIAAVNSLSDVFAMGGTPLAAMNIFCYPFNDIPPDVAGEVLMGGSQKIQEAGAVLAGGHTMRDTEFKYGLAVIGTIHPDKIARNQGALVGDDLILTKALGIGIITTAVKQRLDESLVKAPLEQAIASMEQLNKEASLSMMEVGVHAATDVTGFGLLGHGWEMAENSDVALEISASTLPVIPGTLELLRKGALSGGSKKNRSYLQPRSQVEDGSEELFDIACDAQTSGGLLIALPADKSSLLLEKLKERGVEGYKIGKVVEPRGNIRVFFNS